LQGLSDRKRAFLKQYPLLLQPENTRLLRDEYNRALAEGVADDSDAMETRLLSGIVRRMEGRHNQRAGARAMAEPSIERAVECLDNDANAIRNALNVAASTPIAIAAQLPEAGPALPRARSIRCRRRSRARSRRHDAHVIGQQHIRDGKLCWRPHKTLRSTGKMLSIPIMPTLQSALDAMPNDARAGGVLTLLVNDYGRPFASAAAFGNKFADWCAPLD
jgi:hypothetical protein